VTTYSYSQLRQLYLNAGGSKTFADLMAGVAIVESGGNPDAYNPSGASGLWQIEVPLHDNIIPGGAANVFNPQDNAKAAVALSGTLAAITSNWLVDEPKGAAAAIAEQNGGSVPGSTSTEPVAQPLGSSGSSGPLADVTSAVSQAGTLLGDSAKALDWFFHFFKPGQGWRLAFGAGAVVAAYGGIRSWQSASSSDDATAALPLAVLLFALAALAGFMTLRQWPTSGGKPIVPAAYAVDILEGKPPAAGAAPASDAGAIEVGLGAILAVWAASKAAQGLSGLGGLLAGLGQLFGGAAEDA
jgi:transglycosylase-like protein with SLT domain